MQGNAQTLAPAALGDTAPELAALARLLAGVAPLIALFVLLERWLMATARLPAPSYFDPVIAAGLMRGLGRQGSPLLLLAALVALRPRQIVRGWGELDHGRVLQLFVGGLAIAFAWAFSTYDANLYVDRTHAFDRGLLVLFAGLVCWRPAFLLLFLPLLLAVIGQFEHPFAGYSWTDKNAPLRVLLLFLASFLWLGITGGRRADAFVFAAGCLVAAHYWIPALEKLRLGWLAHGNLHHLTLAAWQNGWLVQLDREEIASLAGVLARGEPLSMGYTIALEAGALFFFWRRGVALGLLAGWALLHAGIFATSGICFWKWALLDAGLLALLVALRHAPSLQIFGPGPLLLSLALITGAAWWCTPVRLGWFDTRLAYTYRYTAFGTSGEAYSLAPSFFAPYDIPFSQNRFDYLTERPALVSTYGMTQDPGIADALRSARTLAEVEALEARMGSRRTDPRKAARFDDFMRRFLAAGNRRGWQPAWYSRWRPPLHIWTAPRGRGFQGQEPIARLRVDRVTTLWDGERLQELRVERVRELAIPTGAAEGT